MNDLADLLDNFELLLASKILHNEGRPGDPHTKRLLPPHPPPYGRELMRHTAECPWVLQIATKICSAM